MPMFESWKPGENLQLVVFARYKVGKTFGALTFPRINMMDFDSGVATAANPEFTSKYGHKNFMYEQFQERSLNKQGVPTQHNAFDDACRYFDACMSSKTVEWTSPKFGAKMPVNKDMFDTWVVDSTTTLFETSQNKAIILLGTKQLAMASSTHDQALKTGLIYMKQQDYGSQRSMVEQFIDMVKGSGKHLVVLSHEAQFMNDAGSVTDILPMYVGGSREAIPLKFDEIYRLTAKKKGPEMLRLLQTHTDGIVKCGTRYGVPNDTEWSYEAIMKFLTTSAASRGTGGGERTSDEPKVPVLPT